MCSKTETVLFRREFIAFKIFEIWRFWILSFSHYPNGVNNALILNYNTASTISMQKYLHAIVRTICLLIIIDLSNTSYNRSEKFSILHSSNTHRFSYSNSTIPDAVNLQHRRLFGLNDILFSSSNDLKRNSCKLYEKLAQNDSTIEVCCNL